MKKYIVLGITENDAKNILDSITPDGTIYTELGVVSPCDCDDENIECEFVEAVSLKYDMNTNKFVEMFCNDGDQNLPFYIGIMYESEVD